jgi:hypothetical protein
MRMRMRGLIPNGVCRRLLRSPCQFFLSVVVSSLFTAYVPTYLPILLNCSCCVRLCAPAAPSRSLLPTTIYPTDTIDTIPRAPARRTTRPRRYGQIDILAQIHTYCYCTALEFVEVCV